jgi:hypothetical protein
MDLINNCPVKAETRRVVELSRETVHGLRRLRRSLHACPSCLRRQHCPFLLSFHGQVNTAIQEVLQEWDRPSDEELSHG